MEIEDIRSQAEEVFDILGERGIPQQDIQRVREAFELAFEAHREQRRKTGEPYIIHPIAVARIVADNLKLDANSVCAAFLHDVVEDTPYTIDDIRERFGDEVAYLVDVVTKKKKTQDGQSKQVANYRQILESVHYDIRALMVKLADRLHNMRTLDSMMPDKQMKVAGETEFIYSPMAGRLGLYTIKRELENLSFRFRCPRDYETLENQLAEDKVATQKEIDAFVDKVKDILQRNGIQARVQVRYRKPYSIWRTMQEDGVDFAHVEFKHYVRIIFPDGLPEKLTALGIYAALTDELRERPASVVNYIDQPKENGYQSFHVKLLSASGIWEECHISSERMIRNSSLGCISKSNSESVGQWMAKIEGMLKDMAETSSENDFMQGLDKAFYNEDIYVLTPSGRVVILPKDSSVIDFAYELHSEIGDHAQFARINGKLSSIKARLNRGDCVFIQVNPDVTPQRDWLEVAKTYKAQRKIHSSLKGRADQGIHRCQCCHPLPGDEIIGVKNAEGLITVHKRNCQEAIKLASEYGDSLVAIDYKSRPDTLYDAAIRLVAIDRPSLLKEILDCISEAGISMTSLNTETKDWIVTSEIKFGVHDYSELHGLIKRIRHIEGIEEISRVY